MAIKNTLMGGTDWVSTDYPKAVDLNDTFDAAYDLVRSNPCFWLNSETYDVVEDFDSISVGTFTGNADWTITLTSPGWGIATITNTQVAGGSTNELNLIPYDDYSDSNAVIAQSSNIVANRHIFCRVALKSDVHKGAYAMPSASISLNGSTYYKMQDISDLDVTYSMLLIVALGSNQYDIYYGGKQIASSITVASPQLYIKCASVSRHNTANPTLTIDDIRQSKVDIV